MGPTQDRGLVVLSLAVAGLGLSAFVVQVIFMRELLTSCAGNELVFGIVLGAWLLLCGAGAALGRGAGRWKDPLGVLLAGQIFVSLAPIAEIFLARALWNTVFVRGAAVGLGETVAVCFVVLAPYCLVAGLLLTLACQVLVVRRGPQGIGQVYAIDSLGGIVGGVAFSFWLVRWLDHFSILYLAAGLNLAAVGAAAWRFRRPMAGAAAVTGLLALATLITMLDLERVSTARQYPGQEVVFSGSSPYGRLVVTRLAGQYNFIENGVMLFSTANLANVEETVHYAMAQRPDARRVLLLGGGVSGTAREILKYGVEAVDYVELDPLILQVAGRLAPESLADRINVIPTDGRLYVRSTQQRYDVVILDVPEPSTFQLNRFFTEEFFAELAGVLRPGGVIGFPLGAYEDYVGPELARLMGVAYHTLRQVFREVLVIPGGRLFFLAANGPLSTEIAPRLEARGIATRLVNRHYLRGMLTPDRLAEMHRAVADGAVVNRDFSPVLYYDHLLYWMQQFKVRFGLLEGALVGLFVVYLMQIRPVALVVFTGGLAASALEIMLLMGFQVLCGSVYQQVSVIVMMFMAGLAMGATLVNRGFVRHGRRSLVWLQAGIALFALALPALLAALAALPGGAARSGAVWAVLSLATMFLAALVGMEFPLAAKLDFRGPADTAARIYTADYLGAAWGALLVSTLLVPLLGVTGVCILAAGVSLLGGGVLLRSAGK